MESGDEASGAEPEDGEMIMEKQVVIKLPGCKKKWAPEYKEIGDRVFIKVCKWDRVISQWILGKAIAFGKKDTTISCEFWENLVNFEVYSLYICIYIYLYIYICQSSKSRLFSAKLVQDAGESQASQKAREDAAVDADADDGQAPEASETRKRKLPKITNADAGLTPIVHVSVGGDW